MKPGETVYFRPGDVTVTLEVVQAQEDRKTDYTKTGSIVKNVMLSLGLGLGATAVGVAAMAAPAAAGAAAAGAAAAKAAAVLATAAANAIGAPVSCYNVRTGSSPHFDVLEDADGRLMLARRNPSDNQPLMA